MKLVEAFAFTVSYVHPDGTHVVGLMYLDKRVIFCNVASADRECLGKRVLVGSAQIVTESDCPPKFYKSYGIDDPYTYGWKFWKLEVGSVTFSEPPPFRPIPLSKAEIRRNTLAMMQIGTKWTNGQKTWVIQDACEERLAGQSKTRIWVTDPNGKKGQAMYAESLVGVYNRI